MLVEAEQNILWCRVKIKCRASIKCRVIFKCRVMFKCRASVNYKEEAE